MTDSRRLILRSAWLGFALAGLFLYPLAAAIDSDPYYLQWQPAHVAETHEANDTIRHGSRLRLHDRSKPSPA